MVDSGSARLEKRISAGRVSESQVEAIASEAVELASNHWDGTEWIACADGKTRPVKPGIQLLAHGIQGRVAQLRGLGNAIVPQVAAVFVKSFLEVVS
jgi:DNA (cytosine-5)-methyltransferase 1